MVDLGATNRFYGQYSNPSRESHTAMRKRCARLDTPCRQLEQLPALLGTIDRTVVDVGAVVLTHDHPDHLRTAKRIHTGADARVLIHTADADGARRGEVNPPMLGLLRALARPFVARYPLHIAREAGLRIPAIAAVTQRRDRRHRSLP